MPTYRPGMPSLGDVVPRNVAAERVRRRWTQAVLAERLGWSKSKMSAFEAGGRAVLADELGEVCKALGVPLAKLAEGVDPEEFAALGL